MERFWKFGTQVRFQNCRTPISKIRESTRSAPRPVTQILQPWCVFTMAAIKYWLDAKRIVKRTVVCMGPVRHGTLRSSSAPAVRANVFTRCRSSLLSQPLRSNSVTVGRTAGAFRVLSIIMGFWRCEDGCMPVHRFQRFTKWIDNNFMLRRGHVQFLVHGICGINNFSISSEPMCNDFIWLKKQDLPGRSN